MSSIKLPLVVLGVCIFVICGGVEKPSWFIHDVILSSPEVTGWGSWYTWDQCPDKQFVIGMQLKTEGYRGIFADDSSLNGVKLFCGEIGFRNNSFSIGSGANERGSFGNEYYCEGIATGFQLRSESSQTVFADDTAANNLRLFCNDNRADYIEGDGLEFGDWTMAQECFSKQAICGIQTQVEMEHGNGDETALNNIKVKCCDIPDPAENCEPSDDWDLIIECDNTEAVSPTTCAYHRKVGISHSRTESEGHYELSEIYSNVGFSLAAAPSVLNINFKWNLGVSHTTAHNWTLSNTEIWSVETSTSVSFDVPPKVKTQLLQTVGNCGIYNVRATRVKRIDTVANGTASTVTYFDL